jgi:decaprenylphospho-beta-D-ribofuranose 2-oxidase
VNVHGWGRYPTIDAQLDRPLTIEACRQILEGSNATLIPRGAGCSYGDSSLAPRIVDLTQLNHLLQFDANTGVLSCSAGVTHADIIRVFLPRGWFLPVTPGTKFVTVGGAVASDVHGKNHHVHGTFSHHVLNIRMMLGNGDIVTCSERENADLFRATCGGMGLTGIILAVTLQLKRVSSNGIVVTTHKAARLEQALDLFEQSRSSTYSVAWIDCMASGKQLGRSLLMLGEHAESGDLTLPPDTALPVPIDLPPGLLNRHTIGAFNALYFHRVRSIRATRTVLYEPYFYPLDKLHRWNRLYGKPGFVQYQFVLPSVAGVNAFKQILQRIVASGMGSFLAVLKVFGAANENLLSFPMEGYTLALDFKNEPAVFPLLDELDQRVLDYGGRVYLTKDSRMSQDTFKRGYALWPQFEEVRSRYGAIGRFASLQSRRLGLQ